MVRCLVGAHGHAADGVQQEGAVDLEDVRVVLRDNVTVFRVLAHDQAADHRRRAEGELGGTAVEFHVDLLHVLADDAAEHGGGLLVEDEGGLLGGLDVGGGVADELVGVGGDEGGGGRVDVEEDTVHRRADLIVRGGVDGALDAFHEARGREFDLLRILAGTLDLGIVVCGEVREDGITAGPCALEGTVADRADADRLVREFLEQVDHMAGGDGDAAVFLGAVHLDGGAERQFGVRGGHFEPVALEGEQEVLEDRKGRLGRDGLRDVQEALQQVGTGNVQFHTSVAILILTNITKISQMA